MCGFIAQLLEHRGFESRWSSDFFRLLFSNCLNWKINCDDHSSLSLLFYFSCINLWFWFSKTLHFQFQFVIPNLHNSFIYCILSYSLSDQTLKFSLAYDRMICIRPTGKFLLLICTYESTIQNAKRPKLCLEVVWEALEIRTKSNKCHWAQRRALFKKYSSLGKHTSLHRLSMRIVRIAPRHNENI